MIKTFVSFHNGNDREYKETLIEWAADAGLVTDHSVHTGAISEKLPNERIRQKIRDEYLRDTEVTVLLLGAETRFRKHVDWELKSSMINGAKNKKNGILVVNLPTSGVEEWYAPTTAEKKRLYADTTAHPISCRSKSEWERRFHSLPRRIIENIFKPEVSISIVPWDKIYQQDENFSYLLKVTKAAGRKNKYDLSRKMRMKDFNPAKDDVDRRV